MAIISKQPIQKRPGYLYYVGDGGYVWGSPLKSNKSGQKYKAGSEVINRGSKMCWINKQGYVETK